MVITMIFVVLGTQHYKNHSNLIEIDEMIEAGGITQEVIAQIGASTYEPRHYKYYRFIDKKQFDKYIAQSSVVIAHCGVGTIVAALTAKKLLVVYPRLRIYHEHVDDHQLDIARAFEKKNYVICRHDNETLFQVMTRCGNYPFAEYVSNTNRMLGIITDFLNGEGRKICFTSSSGGHLEEISRLANLKSQYDTFLVTEKNGFHELSFCSKVYYLSQMNRKELLFLPKFLKAFVQSFYILLKEKPQSIVSTGALATFPVCLTGKLLGKRIIYIESFARVDTASLTGKLMYRIADLFIVQWEELLRIYPKAIYGGSIF